LDKFGKYETRVGLRQETVEEEFATLKKDLEEKTPVAQVVGVEPEGAPKAFLTVRLLLEGYASRCQVLEKALAELQRQLETAKSESATADKDREATAKAKDAQLEVEKKAVGEARKSKADAEDTLSKTKEGLTAEVEGLKAKAAGLSKELSNVEKDLRVAKEKNDKLVERIKELENPKKREGSLTPERLEPADAKVLTVEPDGKYLMVDIGRKDWVEVGMIFTVFEKGAEAEGRREKGKVQIRQVYDEISRAKVIKLQDELDPILPGMILVNPAFKRGTKLEFLLIGRFTEPRMEQILLRYPCTVVGKLTRTTDYLILGDAKPDETKGETAWDDNDEVREAKSEGYRATIMRERDLLNYLGER
jgi:DNA repair exonuclease SbcCD ATPase subunit